MTTIRSQEIPIFRAVAFDLLTALIDSWTLWIDIAGSDELGRAWRRESLRRVTTSGAYQPYEGIVREAADASGVPRYRADALLTKWIEGGLSPWPESSAVLSAIARIGLPTAVVTNCSQSLAEAAAETLEHRFDAIVSAELAGVYKTDPRAYRAGLSALRISDPADVLFVAGSPHDVPGAGAVGMKVYWSNRFQDAIPQGAPPPIRNEGNLLTLPELLLASGKGPRS
ncbi:HAD-IA family hydrolase [Hansschlegelia sp. KR7-227]|uniref:HAD-IA family hydrolase n=1 Tax=Hansschlegelia sp. KR7-227 TaxID=3400914 RepID=UPI003C108E8E